ncbi:MAG: hypothetical protein HFF89_07615 [Oscillibacter sp.]|nr:hypothetical protein [Oscillibacter sp.]MCI8690586.1 hypothetical protein [Oscillibacter sp.]MCI9480802.1 hypothetical protein [Oscillibacter sp.]
MSEIIDFNNVCGSEGAPSPAEPVPPPEPVPVPAVQSVPPLIPPETPDPQPPVNPAPQEPPVHAGQGVNPEEFAKLVRLLEAMQVEQQAVREAAERSAEQAQAAADSARAAQDASAELTGLREKSDAVSESLERLRQSNKSALSEIMNFKTNLSREWSDELKRYRKLFAAGAFDGILRELSKIYVGVLEFLREQENEGLQQDLEWIVLDPLSELFENYGVTITSTAPGSRRSVRTTHAAKTVPTGDPGRNGIVIKSQSPAFLREDAKLNIQVVLVPEQVESYVYREGCQEPVPAPGKTAFAPPENAGSAADAAPLDGSSLPDASAFPGEGISPETAPAEDGEA